MRMPEPYSPWEHEARLILGDPVAAAMQWILEYATELGMSPEGLLSLAFYKKGAYNDYMLYGGASSSWAGIAINLKLWDMYERASGLVLPRKDLRTQFP